MDFLKAIQAMKEGKKVKREHYVSVKYVWFNRTVIEYSDGRNFIISVDDTKATDWEIYEEKKDLSLAEEIYKVDINLKQYDKIMDILKKHNEKVKEDIMSKDGDEFRIDKKDAHKIIDKRSGKL